MATRKMTFTLPEDLAEQFLRRVPARERSKYLVTALNEKLSARNRIWWRRAESRTMIRRCALLKKSSTPLPKKLAPSSSCNYALAQSWLPSPSMHFRLHPRWQRQIGRVAARSRFGDGINFHPLWRSRAQRICITEHPGVLRTTGFTTVGNTVVAVKFSASVWLAAGGLAMEAGGGA